MWVQGIEKGLQMSSRTLTLRFTDSLDGINLHLLSPMLSWDFFGRSDAKAEAPVHWPPHVKS